MRVSCGSASGGLHSEKSRSARAADQLADLLAPVLASATPTVMLLAGAAAAASASAVFLADVSYLAVSLRAVFVFSACVVQDGRHLCLECLDTLVVDTKDAQPLYDEVSSGYYYH
jgi:hypothetical protein